MNRLQQQIIEASQKYYTDGTSDLSDEQFDELLQELKSENPDDPLLTSVGHGYDVDLDTTFGDKVKHLYGPAKSLPKCHDFKEYSSQMKSDTVYASLKLDGMSVVLYYADGLLTLALTRGSGEGEIGIDITSKIKYICPEALKLRDYKFTGAIRGELIMSYSNFDIFKEMYDPEASNPRNSAVGLVKAGQFDENAITLVDLIVYNVVGIDVEAMPHDIYKFDRYSTSIGWLTGNFPNVVQYQYITCNPNMFAHTMRQLREKWYDIYPADGIVISDEEGNINPFDGSRYSITRNAVAFKFPAECKETIVKDVEWKLGRSKNLIPRINFDTVELSGASVSYAHGDNARNILDKRIGPGAIINVTRSGEVIPHVTEVVEGCDNVSLPEFCPSCGALLEWNGVHLKCPNTNCSDFEVQDVLTWCKYIAPFDGLGDVLKLKFFSEYLGGLQNVTLANIYDHESPVEIEGGSAQWNNFCKMYNLLLCRTCELGDAIKALNIPRLGEVNAEKLARHPNIVKSLVSNNLSLSSLNQDQIKEIGNANYESIIDNQWKFERLNYIASQINWEPPVVTQNKGKVVITGKLSVKRDAFEAELKSKGYSTSSSVTKDTLCLITDSPDSGTGKNIQADKLGIQKLSEAEFRSMYLK